MNVNLNDNSNDNNSDKKNTTNNFYGDFSSDNSLHNLTREVSNSINEQTFNNNINLGNNGINNDYSQDNDKEITKKIKINNRRKKIFTFLFIILILVIGSIITVMVLSEMKIIKLPWLEYPEVVNLSQNEVMLKRKSSFQFSTNVYPSQVHYGRVIYESSNPDIAAVNPITGYVDAKSNGITTIKAYLEDYKDIYDTCEVVVSNNHVKVKSISVENENIDILVGNKYLLKYSYNPPNAGVHYFSYMSSDTSILTVDNKGEVTAITPGKALVTILDEASGNQVNQEFTVYNMVENDDKEEITANIENIKVSTTEVTLVVNGEQQIVAEVLPEKANQKLTWKSINSNIATVSEDGLIKGIEVGSTEIIARAVNGINKVINVTVQADYIEVEKMSIAAKDFTLNIGSSKKIGVSITPSNATNQKIIWNSSDSNIATIDQNGRITGVSEGRTSITAQTVDEEITSTITVTVKKVANFVNETDLQISSNKVVIDVGGTSYIKTTISPSNATNKKVTWKSNNINVATVKDGMITGKSAGMTTIVVTTNNKGISRTINVEVKNVEVKSINLSESNISIGKGGEISLYATLSPSNATNKTIRWTSSNNSVASVNNNGFIETKSIGTATITATTNNNIKATCKITVTNESIPVNTINLSNSKIIVKVNGNGSLTPVITPSTATNQRVTWSINNTNIATVNSDGTIIGKKEGIAIITAKTNNGKSASASVVVKNNGASVNYLDGSTIKYWVDNLYGNYAISHIWVKDPYNQIKTELPDKLGELKTPHNLLKKAASKNPGKTIIGINASGFTNASYSTELYKLNNAWKNTSVSPVIFYSGKLIRDYSYYSLPSTRKTYAINKKGELVYYNFGSNIENNKEKVQIMKNDGVKYTFSFKPVLVYNGRIESKLEDVKNIRQTICQIDKNNFIFITSTISNDARSSKGLGHKTIANMMINKGCKTGFTLDGGGSTSLYYVKKGSTSPTKIKIYEGTYGRAVPDVLYFVGE